MQQCHPPLHLLSSIYCKALSLTSHPNQPHALSPHHLYSLDSIYADFVGTKKRLLEKIPHYYQQIQQTYQKAKRKLMEEKLAALNHMKHKQDQLNSLYSQQRYPIDKFQMRKYQELKCSDVANIQQIIDKEQYWDKSFAKIVHRFKIVSIGLSNHQIQQIIQQSSDIIHKKHTSTTHPINQSLNNYKEIPIVPIINQQRNTDQNKRLKRTTSQYTLINNNAKHSKEIIHEKQICKSKVQNNNQPPKLMKKQLSQQTLFKEQNNQNKLKLLISEKEIVIKGKANQKKTTKD